MRIFVFFLLLTGTFLSAQFPQRGEGKIVDLDKDSIQIENFYQPTHDDYEYWTTQNALKQPFDTAHTLQNYYTHTFYNNKEYYGNMPFPNVGQTFNPLLFQPNSKTQEKLLPYGKSFYHFEKEDIRFYDVKTPVTEFFYHNGMKEGHTLSSLFTHNISPQFNYAFQYRGLKSEGKYQNSQSNHNNFIISTNYHTKNKRYSFQGFMSNENIDNEENAGIESRENFESGDDNFKNRERLNTNLNGASSKYDYRTYFFEQQFGLTKSFNEDSLQVFPLSLHTTTQYETIHSIYKESITNEYYASSILDDVNRNNEQNNRNFIQTATVAFDWKKHLSVEAGIKWKSIRLFYPTEWQVNTTILPSEIKDNRFGLIGKLRLNIKDKILLDSDAEFLSGDFFKSTYQINNALQIAFTDSLQLQAHANFQSQPAPLQYYLHHNFYTDFNFYNPQFQNVQTLQMGGELYSKTFHTKVFADFQNVTNYTFLDTQFLPQQYSDALSIVQIGFENELSWKKWHLRNRFTYQTISEEDILPLPNWVIRSTLYFQSKAFQHDAADIQTGINFYMFDSFASRSFFPILNDFALQPQTDRQEIGQFPMMDIFLNVKVKTMRFYLQAQHFNSSFTGYNFYSAPQTPFVDFRVNIGIIWYLFT